MFLLSLSSHFCMNNDNCIHELTHMNWYRSFGNIYFISVSRTSYANRPNVRFLQLNCQKMSSVFLFCVLLFTHEFFFFYLDEPNIEKKQSDNNNNNERCTQSVRILFAQIEWAQKKTRSLFSDPLKVRIFCCYCCYCCCCCCLAEIRYFDYNFFVFALILAMAMTKKESE